MNCPDEGQLLLFVEKELLPDKSREIASHIDACPHCAQAVEDLQQTLDFTCERLQPLADGAMNLRPAGQDEVWANVNYHLKSRKREVLRMKFKKMTIAAAVVLALVMVGSIPSVQTAAANFLQVFRVQKVDTLTLNTSDINQIEQALRQGTNGQPIDLENFGTIKVDGSHATRTLDYSELNDLDFKVKLPAGIDQAQGEYSLESTPAVQVTPDVAKVNQFIRALGSNYLLPQALDGQTFEIKVADCLLASYGDFRLLQGPAPEVQAPAGVNVTQIAEAMVGLPIWPDNVKRQLEAVSDWQHTLLIPGENNQKVRVKGQDAVLMNNNSDQVLIWQEDGLIYVLENCSAKNLDLVKIAESLR